MELRELSTVLIDNRKFGIDYKDDLSHCDLHTHSFIEIAYTLSGKAQHTLNGESQIIQANDYIVVEPGSTHQYQKIGTEKLSIINCIFNANFPYPCATENSFYECLKNPVYNISTSKINPDEISRVYHDTSGTVRQLLLLLKDEYEKKDYKYRLIAKNLLNSIILLTLRSLSPDTGSSTYISETLKDYVASHYAEHNVLQVISKQFSYSIPYLSKKFKAETGESFKSYQQNIRINQAASLLIQTNRSISEISNLVGYTDIKYFIKVFTQKRGMSPSKFKKLYGTSKKKES